MLTSDIYVEFWIYLMFYPFELDFDCNSLDVDLVLVVFWIVGLLCFIIGFFFSVAVLLNFPTQEHFSWKYQFLI